LPYHIAHLQAPTCRGTILPYLNYDNSCAGLAICIPLPARLPYVCHFHPKIDPT